MLHLDSKLILNTAAMAAANLCDKFSAEDLRTIGEYCWEGYDADERSRFGWMQRNGRGRGKVGGHG